MKICSRLDLGARPELQKKIVLRSLVFYCRDAVWALWSELRHDDMHMPGQAKGPMDWALQRKTRLTGFSGNMREASFANPQSLSIT